MVQLVRHPQTKERDTDRLHLNHRATSRLYPVGIFLGGGVLVPLGRWRRREKGKVRRGKEEAGGRQAAKCKLKDAKCRKADEMAGGRVGSGQPFLPTDLLSTYADHVAPAAGLTRR